MFVHISDIDTLSNVQYNNLARSRDRAKKTLKGGEYILKAVDVQMKIEFEMSMRLLLVLLENGMTYEAIEEIKKILKQFPLRE